MCIECGCGAVGSETGVTDVTVVDVTQQLNNGVDTLDIAGEM